MPASASAGAPASSPIGLIGEKADLTYPYDYLGAGPERLAAVRRQAAAPQTMPNGRWSSSAPARWRGRTARRLRRSPPRPRVELGAVKDGWNGFSVLHTRGLARRRARYRLRAGRGRRSDTGGMAKPGALDVLFLLGADEIEMPARRLRRLHRHPWRPRRAPRRRHPAGRRLSGEIRPLRQHRRPRADGEPRRLPAGRRARGLGDPARAVRRARRTSCRTTRSAQLRQALFSGASALQRIDQIAPGNAADIEQARQARRHARQGAVLPAGRRFLSHQSDRARLRRHGRMLGAAPSAANHETAAE